MSELLDSIWAYKYMPQNFNDLILKDKETIINFLKNPKAVPSFLFYSNAYGTGKTTTSKLIINYLKCDSIILNASEERGIDVIRNKVTPFVMSLSSNLDTKRCVFFDEADKLTSDAQESLKNIMDTYVDNSFFIFSCNNLSKMDGGIQSRCLCKIDFGRPDEDEIYEKLEYVCKQEGFTKYAKGDLLDLIEYNYPDIRSMVHQIQKCSINNIDLAVNKDLFKKFLALIKEKNIQAVYEMVYSKDLNIQQYNKWMFGEIFKESDKYNLDKFKEIVFYLADNEKSWLAGSDIQIVFLANILKIMDVI